MSLHVLIDCGNQFRHAPEDTTAYAFVGDFTEPSFDHVQPGTGSWNEMQMESRMPSHPRFDSWMLVSPVIVHDQMQIKSGRRLGVDLLEESDKLLMPVARHAIADDLAIEHAQCGEQSGRAIALVIVRHRSAPPLLDWQARLGSIKRLDLAFLIDTKHQGFVGWIEIEADNIGELFNEVLVSADLESLDEVRLEIVLLPNALNAHRADALCFSHTPHAPMSLSRWLGMQGRFNDCADLTLRDAGDATGARRVLFKSGYSQSQEPLSPQLDSRSRYIEPARNLLVGHPLSGHGDDVCAFREPNRNALCVGPRHKRHSFFGRKKNEWSQMHNTHDSSRRGYCQVIYGTLH